MLGFSCLSEFPLSALPVYAPLVAMKATVAVQVGLSSALFDLLSNPDAAIIYVAEIHVGTIVGVAP